MASRNRSYGRQAHHPPCTAIFAFEAVMSELEGPFGTIAVPSGLAACVLPLVAFLKPGDHVLVTDSVYEPARVALDAFIRRNGVEVTYWQRVS